MRSANSQAGWYAGIEFSGRTRISLARKGETLQSVLGLNPDPGPFRTRLVPGRQLLKPPLSFSAPFKAVPMARAISFDPGCATCSAIRNHMERPALSHPS